MAEITIPLIQELRNLQKSGKEVGYRGFYIYLRYQAILTALKGFPISRVLSIGCGYGIFDRLLPSLIDFTGVDIGEKQIEFAHEWAKDNRPSFSYIAGDFRDQGFLRGSFDTIFLSEVIEHLVETDVEDFLNHICDLLLPGGILLLSVPNKWTIRNRGRNLFGRPLVIMDKTHLREYTLKEINELISRFPFKVERFSGAVAYFPFESTVRKVLSENSLFRQCLIHFFPRLASHFIFVLRKVG